ncbi:MAG: outer membrane lipoprotein-sorting protein [Calditrichaeota bacterium]|nr:outer membrane lipoprotein-sorting protein [Calditrichota bacterium]
MRKFKYFMLVLIILVLFGNVSAQSADEILSKADSVMNAPSDMVAVEKMILIDKDGSRKVREVKIYQKGSEKRLIRFLSPADVRSVGFLRLAADRLYLYLPAFRRVRRIASSVKNENFMGTDFSYEDMSQSEYGKDYKPKLIKKTENQFVLELTPRAGADVSYGKLLAYIDKSDYVVRKVEFFDTDGNQVKILTIDNVKKIDGYRIGTEMEMKTVKNGHRTLLKLSKIQFDQRLKDNIFSERNLKRPE